MRTQSNLQLNLFILTFFSFLTLLASEFALRWKDRPKSFQPKEWIRVPEETFIEHHREWGWFQKKGIQTNARVTNSTFTVTTNSEGLRGVQEYTPSTKQNKLRILIAGDSFTFGFGVEDSHTYSAQLAAMNPNLEVLNFGVPGYGVDQIALSSLAGAKQYKPSIVILALYPEDFWRALRAYTDAGNAKPYFKVDTQGKLHHYHNPVPQGKNFTISQFPGWRETGGLSGMIWRSQLICRFDELASKIKKKISLEDPDTSSEWRLGRVILKNTVTNLRQTGSDVLIVLVPPIRWITGTTEPIQTSLQNFTSKNKVHFLDLTPIFKEAVAESSIENYYIRDDHHWTKTGHILVANQIYRFLIQNKMSFK